MLALVELTNNAGMVRISGVQQPTKETQRTSLKLLVLGHGRLVTVASASQLIGPVRSTFPGRESCWALVPPAAAPKDDGANSLIQH